MRIVAALMVVLALAGSAMAWEITDNLQYTYTKDMYQQAGAGIVSPALNGAKSQASFYDPASLGTSGTGTYKSAAKIQNELVGVWTDRDVYYPAANLNGADFAAVLTQGGDATVNMHSMNCFDNSVPEMAGESNAYQNLQLLGGFGAAGANFDSQAMVGVDSVWTTTDTQWASASVSADQHGGGEINAINMGTSVNADIEKAWDGTGWDTPSYSGGITMWAGFSGACDPTCANPIESTVSGSAHTSIFPGNQNNPLWGGSYYWGSDWNTADNPFPTNP